MSIDRAKRVLEIEARAVARLAERVGPEFPRAMDIILGCGGKVIVMGIGKSGLIGRKIAATLASTGTPAFFVHPAEGVHGDVGMISKGDVILIVSHSGETEELVRLVPVFKRLMSPIIGILGHPGSTLAKAADAVLDVSVEEEACPLRLAPTASTTAALAMGDALALALLEKRGFTTDDFARLHPAGALGKRLLLRVCDLMVTGAELPAVPPEAPLKDVVIEISGKMLGHAAVSENGYAIGVVSDGDLRRAMQKDADLNRLLARDLMTPGGKWIGPEELAAAAVAKMERHSITALLVCEEDARGRKLLGLIHLHHLLKAGVV